MCNESTKDSGKIEVDWTRIKMVILYEFCVRCWVEQLIISLR